MLPPVITRVANLDRSSAHQAPTGVAACSHGCQPVEVSLITHPSPDRGTAIGFALPRKRSRRSLNCTKTRSREPNKGLTNHPFTQTTLWKAPLTLSPSCSDHRFLRRGHGRRDGACLRSRARVERIPAQSDVARGNANVPEVRLVESADVARIDLGWIAVLMSQLSVEQK